MLFAIKVRFIGLPVKRPKYIYIRNECKMKFNKDTKIGEILQVAPEKAEILIECGMHCIGCPASQMETLQEACEVHGIDVEEVIEKLNA